MDVRLFIAGALSDHKVNAECGAAEVLDMAKVGRVVEITDASVAFHSCLRSTARYRHLAGIGSYSIRKSRSTGVIKIERIDPVLFVRKKPVKTSAPADFVRRIGGADQAAEYMARLLDWHIDEVAAGRQKPLTVGADEVEFQP